MTPKEIVELSERRADLGYELEKELKRRGQGDAKYLYALILAEILSKLSTQKGRIVASAENIRLINRIDQVFNQYQSVRVKPTVELIYKQLLKIFESNRDYFNALMNRVVSDAEAKRVFNALIGVTAEGKIITNGYLNSLLADNRIVISIRQSLADKIINGRILEDSKRIIKEHIQGTDKAAGIIEKQIEEEVIQSYPKTDSIIQTTYADIIGIKDFIYQGTKRRDSRHFCIKRKGKVFNTDEADNWKDLIGTFIGKKPAGPIVGNKDQTLQEKKDNYNWKIDRGGWGCVDMISFVSPEVADYLKNQQ